MVDASSKRQARMAEAVLLVLLLPPMLLALILGVRSQNDQQKKLARLGPEGAAEILRRCGSGYLRTAPASLIERALERGGCPHRYWKAGSG